ncbi:GNAT family N-acetyltransferase [Oscillatoria sp. CS-180]|uniref:GNAT family N-acetyltransferase n=1 Tax=Oscillatoria sp. CS-180 TaxID=3021720 RepID=UPI00232C9EB5|nr:GNAT family N-acetyltransferase [Oscillatoria sp. CS-180]MDB9527618.1 GNAT family N-acetyltransferase [Oscillatoria sp. CS-180]
MELSRRFARSEDIELLFTLNRVALKDHVIQNFGVWDEDFQRTSFWNSTDPNCHELFYDGAQPVGFWCVTRTTEPIYLERFSLIPTYQNRGIGTHLIGQLIEEARAADYMLVLAGDL